MPERATVTSRSEESAEVVRVREGSLWQRTEREGVLDSRTMRKVMRQMPPQAGRLDRGHGEAVSESGSDETRRPRSEAKSTGSGLLEAALRRENLLEAWKGVKANKGAAGVDGLDIEQTKARLVTEWPAIGNQLRAGTYRPQPVRPVTIPTVTDRMIR